MDSYTASTVDVTTVRKAMGSFPTGVTVVTVASGDANMHGVTADSAMFDGVPLEPGVTGCPVLAGAAASLTAGCGSRTAPAIT
jgi:flavin reductase (DIM6/NTAB) family NADH-FMN oxidoreductase RutF